MDAYVKFVENILGYKLLDYQKEMLQMDCGEYFTPNLTDEEKKDLKEKSKKCYGLNSGTLYIDEFIGTWDNEEDKL